MLKEEMNIDAQALTEKIVHFIKDKLKSYRRDGAIIGISGGLDSACIAALLSRALEREKILGLIMPERDSADTTRDDAQLVANRFDIPTKLIDITSVLKSFRIYEFFPGGLLTSKKLSSRVIRAGYRLLPRGNNPFHGGLLGAKKGWMRNAEAYYRIKHRIRMVHLYYYSEQLNYLVVGTSNKSEDMVGFFVKYGDGSADIMPVADLYKTQVRELSRWLGVPKTIIQKAPSPDLLPGLTDELAMKISYEKLDLVLLGIEKDMEESEIAREAGVNVKTVRYVRELLSLSEHMRNVPEVCRMD
ncbi:NAD(+) synthase [candidate division WOR-3 bacterium JGI_Cruoil_03_44_89]|uniref:NH(3)-dependent NAD(+) synthetase n=1 Tax=candidate division WOR-3 bacterium JGI_Cruoil_03_44_89 TaxID=1973748 RepID=A0A235BX17_UNCW3|nr:MAG: NAD(+) synthase [candidate division WOR-3 bacterium JGI_Cruoil_03_44_89]